MDPETLELKRKARALQEQNDEMLRRCDREKRNPNEHEYARFQSNGRELDFLLEEIKHTFDEPPLDARASQDGDDSPDRRDGLREGAPTELRTDRSWAALCRATSTPMDNGGFRSASEFYAVLASGRGDERLKRAQSEGSDSAGGYSVPSLMAQTVLDLALQDESIRPRCRVFPLSAGRGSTLRVPAWHSTDRSGSEGVAGLQGVWLNEGGTMSVDTAAMRAINFDSKKLGIFGKVTSELSSDSPVFASEFERVMAQAAAFEIDKSLIRGDGAGKPLGILSSNALITVARGTANTIVYQDVINLWSRLAPGSHRKAVWLCSPSTLPQLLKLIVGTDAAHVPILRESSGAYSLLGRELIVNEHLSALGTEGDLLLADLTQYGLLLRSDISLMISPHIFFDSDQLGFRLLARLDGQSMQANAVVPSNGGSSLSPFVTLTDAA